MLTMVLLLRAERQASHPEIWTHPDLNRPLILFDGCGVVPSRAGGGALLKRFAPFCGKRIYLKAISTAGL